MKLFILFQVFYMGVAYLFVVFTKEILDSREDKKNKRLVFISVWLFLNIFLTWPVLKEMRAF